MNLQAYKAHKANNEAIKVLLNKLPDMLLHWLACMFAEHAMNRLVDEGVGVYQDAVCAVQRKRRWVVGQADWKDVVAAHYDAERLTRRLGDEDGYYEHGACVAASGPVSQCAMKASKRARLVVNEYGMESDSQDIFEWQLEAAAWLVEVDKICGERAPWLIEEGKCPIPRP